MSKVKIDIYIVTETERLRLPEKSCEECNLFIRAAEEASKEVEREVNIEVHSWWINLLTVLMKGGYHPPVMIINGEKFCQGSNVPSKRDIENEISKTKDD